MKSYDILNGGLEQLARDLEDYALYLSSANATIVGELSKVAKNDIQANASRAYEIEQELALYSNTRIEQHKRGRNISSDRIINDNPKASFAEFGYGIIGKNSPYSHSDFLNRYAIGWYGYDVNTKYKRPNRSWFYRDMFGVKHNTFGATPRNIFYNAGQKVLNSFPSIATSILNRWSK